MSEQHIEGPWHVEHTEPRKLAVRVWNRNHDWIGDVSTRNGELIASAPDLLAACKAILACEDEAEAADGWANAIDAVRAAVARAEGWRP